MLHTTVPQLNIAIGRLIGGVLILSADHPIGTALILVGLAGASGAVMLDAVAKQP